MPMVLTDSNKEFGEADTVTSLTWGTVADATVKIILASYIMYVKHITLGEIQLGNTRHYFAEL